MFCPYSQAYICYCSKNVIEIAARVNTFDSSILYRTKFWGIAANKLVMGDIMILSFIVILKCHDNQNRREIFNIVISPTQYYRKYRDYWKIHCPETFISVEYFHNFSACSTVKWYRDNIDYHDNYCDDISWLEIFVIAHPYNKHFSRTNIGGLAALHRKLARIKICGR